MNNTILSILAVNLPLVLALAFLLIYLYRNKVRVANANKQPQYYQQPEKLPEKERMLLDADGEDDFEDIKIRLIALFEKEKSYLNPNIRIADIAGRLYTNKTYLSRAIKSKTNKNFCQLVHYYRVREAIRQYSDNPELSITELCKKVGFNSMTTFNSAFGRNTGYTPAEWCKDYKKKNCSEDVVATKSKAN